MDFNIGDYLYAVRRRLWLPIAAPLVAAIATGGILYFQPEQYQATATVVVPALSARGYSTSAVTQYCSTFKDVLTSTPVINKVASLTGESTSNLAAGLNADVITASSNIILVTYTGPNKKTVGTVAQTAAVTSLDILLGPQLSGATTEVATAQATLDAATKALNDYNAQSTYPFPVDEYKYEQQELSALLVQLDQAQLAGDRSRIKGLNTIIVKRQKQLLDLAPIVTKWMTLDQAVSAAESVSNHASVDLNQVNAEIASDRDPGTVTVKNNGHISRVPVIVRFAGVAAGVALLVSLAFIVFMEFFRPALAQVPYLRRLAAPVRPASAASGEAAAAAVSADSLPELALRGAPANRSNGKAKSRTPSEASTPE